MSIDTGVDTPSAEPSRRLQASPEQSLRRSQRSSGMGASLSHTACPPKSLQRSGRHSGGNTAADKLRRAVTQGSSGMREPSRVGRQTVGYLATPDTSEIAPAV